MLFYLAVVRFDVCLPKLIEVESVNLKAKFNLEAEFNQLQQPLFVKPAKFCFIQFPF